MRDWLRRTRGANLVAVIGERMRLVAVDRHSKDSMRIGLVGDMVVNHAFPDGRVRTRRLSRRRSKRLEIVIPSPAADTMTSLHRARRRLAPVNVYVSFKVHRGSPVALESFTIVGDGLYYDIDGRVVHPAG